MNSRKPPEWICPVCMRHFSRKNQFHSCMLYSINEHHLKGVNQDVKSLYNAFVAILNEFGTVTLEPLKTIIAAKKNSQFCSIKVQKSGLKIAFRMFSLAQSPRFSNTSQQDRMFYYEVKIKSKEDMDDELKAWLKQAYLEN
ncbi:MAG: DUF5655 domain-containing protein [Candidatus Hodarchaeota archaeon]